MHMFATLELEPRPLLRAAAAAGALCGLIALGNHGGRWLDPALLGYLIASVFACFGVAYRYFTWLERPATAMYWRWTARTLVESKSFSDLMSGPFTSHASTAPENFLSRASKSVATAWSGWRFTTFSTSAPLSYAAEVSR